MRHTFFRNPMFSHLTLKNSFLFVTIRMQYTYATLLSLITFLVVVYYCLFRFQQYNNEKFTTPFKLQGISSRRHQNHSLLFPYDHHHFNCSAIINGSLAEVRRAERYVNSKLLSANWTKILYNANCQNLIYDYYPVTQVELDFPLAFGIIAYKNPLQVLKLFRALYRPWNYYCIHLDSKAHNLEPLVELLKQCYPNNFAVADVRENIKWGEMNLLKGALHCMTKLSTNSLHKWKYYMNIAGSDFPLKTNLEMVKYFINLNNSSDVQDLHDDDSWKYKYSFRNGISKKSLDDLKFALKTGNYYPTKSPVPYNLTVHKGSFSGAFQRNFVKFILEDKISLDFRNWLNDTFIPDEAYWSTLYHSYYSNLISEEVLSKFLTRYTHWGDNKPRCSGSSEHGLCIFGLFDLKWLVKMPHLFAHKFDETIQPITLDCIEQFIKEKHEIK